METQPHASFILSKDSLPHYTPTGANIRKAAIEAGSGAGGKRAGWLATESAAAGRVARYGASGSSPGCSLRGRRQRSGVLTPGPAAAVRGAHSGGAAARREAIFLDSCCPPAPARLFPKIK
ncbi:hypothetical protein ABU162_10445 [Paenibacillus thiaminolyticus]|uniref:hypothetical protein n=1 Tax=Paenibacillus thiaminolyticus TaxID=49283 RepID=UPI0035A6F7C9